jgi:hypothetical protein
MLAASDAGDAGLRNDSSKRHLSELVYTGNWNGNHD